MIDLRDSCKPSNYLSGNNFLNFCNNYNNNLKNLFNDKYLIMTLDCEIFGAGEFVSQETVDKYIYCLDVLAKELASRNFSASFCLVTNSFGDLLKTPELGVNNIINNLGVDAIEFHATTHNVGSTSAYQPTWFLNGFKEMAKYNANVQYWAPPSWIYSKRTSEIISKLPTKIKAVRGVLSGPSFTKEKIEDWKEFNFIFPYQYNKILYFPFQYVDFMTFNIFGHILDYDIVKWHQYAINCLSSQDHFMMETIVHPFRLANGDIEKNLDLVRKILDLYLSNNIKIINAKQAITICDKLNIPNMENIYLPDPVLKSFWPNVPHSEKINLDIINYLK